jgi:VWFA-related protein
VSRPYGRFSNRSYTGLLVALLGLSLAAEHAEYADYGRGTRPQQPAFRAAVDVVSLDVTVLDKNRRPVRGLTAADFSVTEGGRLLPIVAFAEVVLPKPSIDAAAAPWLRDAARDVVANDPNDGRLVVIMFDHTIRVGAGPAARKIGNAIIDQLGPGDLAAVIFTQHLARPQNFTADKARLRESLQSPVIGASLISNTAETGQCMCGLCSLEAVKQVAKAMEAVPRRQKALFFIGGAIAVDVKLESGQSPCDPHTIPATADMFLAAQRANVVIHALDPNGLLTDYSAERRRTDSPRGGPPSEPPSLRILAERTGGRAVLFNNEAERMVPALFAESSSYYLIGFEAEASRAAANPRAFRPVDVRVSGRDVSVQRRSGYYPASAAMAERAALLRGSAASAGQAPVALGPSPLESALQGQLPKTDIPLRVAIAPFRSDAADPTLAITMNLNPDPPLAGRVEALTTAYDTDGNALGSQRLSVELPDSRAAGSTGPHELLSRIELRPGRYEIRLAAREERSGRIGSVYTFVDVPDFRRDALSLSGVVVRTSPGPRPLASGGLESLLPIAPTAARSFTTASTVRAFARVYQSESAKPRAVTVRARILDASNRLVFDRTTALSAQQFRNGAADYLLDLPVAQLAPGAHLLTIEASAGRAPVGRQVRFFLTR